MSSFQVSAFYDACQSLHTYKLLGETLETYRTFAEWRSRFFLQSPATVNLIFFLVSCASDV